MYSKPDDWDFETRRIAKQMSDGRDSIRNGIKELEKAGYLLRHKQPDGRMQYLLRYEKDYLPKPMTEKPSQEKEENNTSTSDNSANDGKPDTGKPMTENPNDGKPHCGKTRHISNKECKKQRVKSNTTAETSSADSQDEEKSSMLLPEFVDWCRGSPHRHINIIAEYADEKQLNFETKEQWKQFIGRNVRPAKRLSPFTDDQISQAMTKLNSDKKENDGFITRWTLETLEKYLHN